MLVHLVTLTQSKKEYNDCHLMSCQPNPYQARQQNRLVQWGRKVVCQSGRRCYCLLTTIFPVNPSYLSALEFKIICKKILLY